MLVELGSAGRQEDGRDAVGDGEAVGAAPAGSVHLEERVGAGCHLPAGPGEEGLHVAGGGDRQDQAEGRVAPGTGGTERVDGLIAPILEAVRAGTFLAPAPAIAPRLADPGLVLQLDPDALGLELRSLCLGDQAAELFLNSAGARRSVPACAGCVLRQERSRPCSSSSMPFSL